jgi:hypothetical protein
MPQTKPRITFNIVGRRRLGGTYSSRGTGPLTREELDVRDALTAYTTTGATTRDWIIIAELWSVYTRWWARHRREWVFPLIDGQYPRLTVRQFGRAVQRVFPGIERVRRRRQHGLIGPAFRWRYGYRGLRKMEQVGPAPADGL